MRLPRSVSAQELIKALQLYQYAVDRQKGSHIRLSTKLNGEHHITIPNHDPLGVGTLSAIIGEIANHLGKTKEDVIEEFFG